MTEKYNTVKFTDIYNTVTSFISDYTSVGIPETISRDNASTLYYLLYAKYGNNPIANNDTTQFKYKLFSIIFQFGPTWEKKLAIQGNLRNLTDDEIRSGNKAVYNHAFNPSTAPTTSSLDELEYINDQNTTNIKRGRLEGYSLLLELLETDVTGPFIDRFKILFKMFVAPENHVIYETEYAEEEEDE